MTTTASPPPPPQWQIDFMRGFELHKSGRTGEAAALYQRSIDANPDNVDGLHLLGLLKAQAGDAGAGERLIGAALKLKSDVPMIWMNYGNVLDLLGRSDDAVASFDRAIALQPGYPDAIFNRGNVLMSMGRAAEALAGFDTAPELVRSNPPVAAARAGALMHLKRWPEALAGLDDVLSRAPGHVDSHINRATSLRELGRLDEAMAGYDAALRLAPGHPAALSGRAQVLMQQDKLDEAGAIAERVLQLHPGNAAAWYVMGHVNIARQRLDLALFAFETADTLKAAFVEAIYNRGDVLRVMRRDQEALIHLERVRALEPDHPHVLNGIASVAMQCCDWERTQSVLPAIEANIGRGTRGQSPFAMVSLTGSPELQLACARLFTRSTCPVDPPPLFTGPHYDHDRIRLAYMSSDFRRHAMAYQMAELFEVHDRRRFEVIGVSCSRRDGSEIRRRIERSFDQFIDAERMSGAELAQLIREREIDIAVDLNGHTVYSRIGALAYRPAPVQVTYLGYPGSTGADFVDYVIADAVVAPFEEQHLFSERIVHLPGCYQVSDRKRAIAPEVPTRAASGLPADGFVFCCFNTSYKLAPEIFAVWMRILAARPGSVLWLVRGNDAMVTNLRRAAQANGIDPARLVFCEPVEPEQHLARHVLADLYLDTLPYNSHGTGSFALWAGLPILACHGPTFAGRVAASLLYAIGLPELVTQSLADYEAKALALSADPVALNALRQRLAANIKSTPLFDTDRFARNIESAYRTMLDIARRGEPPRSFAVADTAP